MIHQIHIHNKSTHNQTFEVHGWHNNQNITVKGGATTLFPAPDGSSGAIIALHEGHEGEQAEITKNGFGGNDFFDLSNIVGAGGNMTVMQVGEPQTLKGDPKFMQHMDTAYHKASQEEKNKLKNCIFLDPHGKVKRIGPIKDNPELEKLVRTFADGKTYVGVGSWQGNPGNPNDNAQSSAGHGNKDILVTYSDGDASPGENPPAPAPIHTLAAVPIPASHPETTEAEIVTLPPQQMEGTNPLMTFSVKSAQIKAVAKPSPAPGPGIILTNKSHKECAYYFYDNYWNGNGTAGANFDHPLKHIFLLAGHSTHVPLPTTFKGRLQRGTQLPCTWVEFQIEASNDHAAHGDISLQQGCDGAATIASTDGSNRKNGFTNDVLKDAPAAACVKRGDGVKCTQTTMGNWMSGPNKAAIDYLNKVVGHKKAYITGGTGTDDVGSKNKCLAVDMY